MKPSELIAVLQQAIDAGLDDETEIYFDTEGRAFTYHMAKVGKAYFNNDEAVVEAVGRHISLHEARG